MSDPTRKKRFLWVFLPVFSFILFSSCIYGFCYFEFAPELLDLKYRAIVFFSLTALWTVGGLINRVKRTSIKAVLAVGGSLLYALLLLLGNSLLHYWENLSWFDGDGPNYWKYVVESLTFSLGLAEYRYPAAFVGMLLLLLVFYVFADKIKNFFSATTEDVCEKLVDYSLNKDLESRLSDYGRAEIDITEYFLPNYDDKETDIDKKYETLLRCIEEYECRILYEILFETYSERLTEKDYIHYKNAYLELFPNLIPTRWKALDKKFGLLSIEEN